MSSRSDVGVDHRLLSHCRAGGVAVGDTLMLAAIIYIAASLLLVGGIIAIVRKVCG